jgi:hypothetical protein
MGPSSQVITLTPPLSRKPGEGVPSSRTYKGLFGAESAEDAEDLGLKGKRKNLMPGKFVWAQKLDFSIMGF